MLKTVNPQRASPTMGKRLHFHSGNVLMLLGFAFTLMLVPLVLGVSAQTPSPQVLILNSYLHGYAWSDDELTWVTAKLMQKYLDFDHLNP
jgi:hypothetical protein